MAALALAAASLLLPACQSFEPPPQQNPNVTTIGNTTIRTSGSVRMDVGLVN